MHRCPRARHLLGLAFLAVGPALILHGCRAPAPAGGPHWTVSSPADSVGVGDPFAVVFEGVWPDSVGSAHLVWPVAADSLAVLRRDSTAVATRAGSRGMRYELTAVALRRGVQRLPPAALVSARGRTVAVAAVAPRRRTSITWRPGSSGTRRGAGPTAAPSTYTVPPAPGLLTSR